MHKSFSRKALLLALFVAVYLVPFVRALWRVGDEGTMVYGAQRVAEGAVPYRDFFVENAGPATFYILGGAFRLFGATFLTARAVLLATGVLTAVLVYWLTRRVYRGTFESLPAILVALLSIPLWPATSHHWDSNLFALAAVGAFCKWKDSGRKAWLAAAGILAGVTSCSMQQKGLLILLGLLVSLGAVRKRAGEPPGGAARAGWLAGGYGAVGLVVVFLFWTAGGLRDLVFDTLIWPLTSYSGLNSVPYGFGMGAFWDTWKAALPALLPVFAVPPVRALMGAPLLLILALPAVAAGLAVAGWRRSGRPGIFDAAVLPYWLAGAGLWISEIQRKDWAHLIYGAPLLLIAGFVAWNRLLEKHPGWRRLPLAGLAAGMYLLAGYNALAALTANRIMPTRRGPVYAFQEDGALRFLHEKVGPGENVFVYPYYSMYYFLAGVRNPTRHTMLLYHVNTDAQFQAAIGDLERRQVRYVLWDTVVENARMQNWFPAYRPPPPEQMRMEAYLSSRFEVIEIRNGFRILRRRDSGARRD